VYSQVRSDFGGGEVALAEPGSTADLSCASHDGVNASSSDGLARAGLASV